MMEHQTAGKTDRADSQAAKPPELSPRLPVHPLIQFGHNAGNKVLGSVLQAKYQVGQPGDANEQEADRVSDQVMAMPAVGATPPPERAGGRKGPPLIQRACAKCEDEFEKPVKDEEGTVQTKEAGKGLLNSNPAIASSISNFNGGGDALPAQVRTFFEPRFGHDFGSVRIHTGAEAAESTRELNALAFTVGSNIAFAPGQYSPVTESGRKLLAHELTHVVQQGHSETRPDNLVQRQVIANQPAEAGEPGTVGPGPTEARETLIVDDDSEVRPGQMKKTEFLARVQAEVCREWEDAMKGTGQTTDGCPYVEKWFGYYADKSSAYVERALRKYAPEAARATSAAEYIPLVATRVRRSVEVWAQTGEITGVPEELAGAVIGGTIMGAFGSALSTVGSAIGSAVSAVAGGIGRVLSGIGSLLFKGREGGPNTNVDPAVVTSRLGKGEGLGAEVKSRMEAAFGHDFSSVRVHPSGPGSEMADRLNARAFTVGHEIGFGANEYQPGTIVGDALIAHELAHVVQQSASNSSPPLLQKGESRDGGLEEDADLSAAHAVASIWGGANKELAGMSRNAMPQLRSGLRLQRCPKVPATRNPFELKEPELFQTVKKCPDLTAATPATYDPDYSPPVVVRPEQETYRYDFTYSADPRSTRGLDSAGACGQQNVEAEGCMKLRVPTDYKNMMTPVACFKPQSIGDKTLNSPLEAGLQTFPLECEVFVPVERLSTTPQTKGTTDDTMNHELHHLVVAYEIIQEFKGRLAFRIRERLVAMRRQAALQPDKGEQLLSKASIDDMMKQEALPFYDWFAIESTERQKPIDAAGALPPVTIPSSWTAFRRPVPRAGDTGSFTP
jgi:hypothetical protein